MIQYFAYGSNMNPQRISDRIGRMPDAQSARPTDYVLRFNKRSKDDPRQGYANIEPCEGSEAPGVLFGLTEEDLKRLDRKEGVGIGHYEHLPVVVETAGEEQVQAVAHIACTEWKADGLLPSQEYLDHLLAGRDWLPEAHVRWLAQHPVLEG